MRVGALGQDLKGVLWAGPSLEHALMNSAGTSSWKRSLMLFTNTTRGYRQRRGSFERPLVQGHGKAGPARSGAAVALILVLPHALQAARSSA